MKEGKGVGSLYYTYYTFLPTQTHFYAMSVGGPSSIYLSTPDFQLGMKGTGRALTEVW